MDLTKKSRFFDGKANLFNKADPAIRRQMWDFTQKGQIRGIDPKTARRRAFVLSKDLTNRQVEAQRKTKPFIAAQTEEVQEAGVVTAVASEEEIRLQAPAPKFHRRKRGPTEKAFRKSLMKRAQEFGVTLKQKEITKWLKQNSPRLETLGPEEVERTRFIAIRDLFYDIPALNDINEIE
jgi:hypothetical protein